jgi:hypothetical protein
MTLALLFVQLAICLSIVWKELVVNKFRRIATSTFFLFYLILYIVEPIVIHLFYGGPRSIIRDASIVVQDDYVFFVFNILGISLLMFAWLMSRTTVNLRSPVAAASEIGAGLLSIKNPVGLLIPLGFYLFYKSTGLSLGELFVASRFAWFESASYNPLQAVAGAYLIALTPVYLLLFLQSSERKFTDYLVITLVVVSLLMYGVVTKDRKWIFYLLSGWLASAYLRGGRTVRISARSMIVISVIVVVILLSQILRDVLPQMLMGQEKSADVGEGFGKSLSRIFVESDLAYFYNATIEAIHQNVNNGLYITLGLVRRLFFFFLPTSMSMGLKVEDMSAIFSDVVSGGDEVRRGNMPPGLFGLFIVSFGFVTSCLLMPVLACILRALDLLFLRSMGLVTVNLLGFLLVGIVFFFRGDESTVIYFPIFNLFITAVWALVTRLAKGELWQK